MAPRRRQPKVGLTRMHAALDAMRPMGFSRDTVRKCVKNLLKVYGDEGWAFIEDSAYKLLIDTILEEPMVLQHDECEPHENLPAKGDSEVAHEQQESVIEPSGKKAAFEEKSRGPSVNKQEMHCKDVKTELDRSPNKEVLESVKAEIVPLQDVSSSPNVGPQLGFPVVKTPESSGINPKTRAYKPCFGWISDDEDDDEFLQLTPAAKGLGK